jgi:hypothetical protein
MGFDGALEIIEIPSKGRGYEFSTDGPSCSHFPSCPFIAPASLQFFSLYSRLIYSNSIISSLSSSIDHLSLKRLTELTLDQLSVFKVMMSIIVTNKLLSLLIVHIIYSFSLEYCEHLKLSPVNSYRVSELFFKKMWLAKIAIFPSQIYIMF